MNFKKNIIHLCCFIKQHKKTFILLVAIITIIISIFVLWNNEAHNIDLIFNSLLIGMGINVMSAMILIYFLEERDRKNKERQELQKQTIINSKLSVTIKDFNILIKNMYKATMTEEVSEHDKILDDLYYNIDNLYNQINNVNFTKTGYMCAPTKDIFNPIEYNWHQCYVIGMHKLFDSIENIINLYAADINIEILERLEKILFYKRSLYLIDNSIISSVNQRGKTTKNGEIVEIGKALFEFVQLKNILINISEIMQIINKNSKKNNFKLEVNDFNGKGISPSIGSAL